jgi:hypothetical protein
VVRGGSRLVLAAAIAYAVVGAVGAGPARAATVTGHAEGFEIRAGGELEVTDAHSERNNLSITQVRDRIFVRERGPARLHAAVDCRQRKARLVVCDLGYVDYVDVTLGGAADRAVVDGSISDYFTVISAAPGSDRVKVTKGSAEVYGGGGRDTLIGGPGSDTLYGSGGPDLVYGRGGGDFLSGDGTAYGQKPRPAASDLLDGGPGFDYASWEERQSHVAVDLRRPAHGGGAGEHDRLPSIEAAVGGSAGDRLVGNADPNLLLGGPGPDVLRGGGGGDEIDAGRAVTGEAARPDGAADSVACGDGNDLVRGVGLGNPPRGSGKDVLTQDCERMGLEGHRLVVPRLPLGERSVRVQVGCGAEHGCWRRVVLDDRGTELGHSRQVKLRFDTTAWLTVPLGRPLGFGPPIDVKVVGRDRDYSGAVRRHDVDYRLRRG